MTILPLVMSVTAAANPARSKLLRNVGFWMCAGVRMNQASSTCLVTKASVIGTTSPQVTHILIDPAE
jgi:hypothetical protein